MTRRDWAFGTIVGNRTEKVMFVRLDRDGGWGTYFWGMRLDSKGPNRKVGVLGRYPTAGFRAVEEAKP